MTEKHKPGLIVCQGEGARERRTSREKGGEGLWGQHVEEMRSQGDKKTSREGDKEKTRKKKTRSCGGDEVNAPYWLTVALTVKSLSVFAPFLLEVRKRRRNKR